MIEVVYKEDIHAAYPLLSPAPTKWSGGYGNAGCPSIRLRYVVSALRFLFVDQLISNLHTGIILEISSLSSKLGKIRYLEDFRPEECDSDKCDLKMAAIAAIMAAIFNMVAKTLKKLSAPMLQLQRKLIFKAF